MTAEKRSVLMAANCKTCGGTGEIDNPVSTDVDQFKGLNTCPVCKGSGRVLPCTPILSREQVASLNERGFLIIKGFWPEMLLRDWEQTLVRMYLMQATRVAPIRDSLEGRHRLVSDRNARFSVEDFDAVLGAIEAEDKELGYQALPMIERSAAGRLIVAHLADIGAELLNSPPDLLTLDGPSPFINLPSTKRLLYHWHSEATYYPKRRRFLNLWFPIFRNKREDNGTMWLCQGSHKQREWQFIEYQGFDKESLGKRNHFIQYEVPEAELTAYEKVPVIADRGDLVIFDRAMVHASTVNQSGTASYATVARIFDYRTDLTLSGASGTRPFGQGDYGRPDLLTHD